LTKPAKNDSSQADVSGLNIDEQESTEIKQLRALSKSAKTNSEHKISELIRMTQRLRQHNDELASETNTKLLVTVQQQLIQVAKVKSAVNDLFNNSD
jgi:high-affinity K+ transport system ATPase subunit B